MSTVKHAIGEHDVVALRRPVDKDEVLTRDPGEDRGIGQWPAGTEGTVVSDYGKDKLIEISNEKGVALDFLTIPVQQLRLVTSYSKAIKAPAAPIRPRRQRKLITKHS